MNWSEATGEVFDLELKGFDAGNLVLVAEFLEEECFSFEEVLFGGDVVVFVLFLVEGEKLAVDVGYTVVEV